MWKLRRAKAPVTRPVVPDGLRIYAVGDVHGRADLLKKMFARIDEDPKVNLIAETMQVFSATTSTGEKIRLPFWIC